jgi:DNA-binding response OmpR family regulator
LIVLADHDRARLGKQREALEAAGFQVRPATGPADAAACCRSAAVFAVVMPFDAGAGADALKGLRADPATASVRVVLSVETGDQSAMIQAQMARADAVLMRPFDPPILVSCLRTLQTAIANRRHGGRERSGRGRKQLPRRAW